MKKRKKKEKIMIKVYCRDCKFWDGPGYCTFRITTNQYLGTTEYARPKYQNENGECKYYIKKESFIRRKRLSRRREDIPVSIMKLAVIGLIIVFFLMWAV